MMKYLIKTLMLLVVLVTLSCQEHEHEPMVKDGDAPAVVKNVTVTPINGGLELKYDLPNSSNLLYVKAVYTNSSGNEAEVKVSSFNNKIVINGYKDTEEKIVKLYSVSRSESLSDAVTVKGTPLTPPFRLIQESMDITADFGGAKFSWTNQLKAPVAIDLISTNKESGKKEVIKTVYTQQQQTKSSLRGYESVPRFFAAVVRDRYDNLSDTIFAETSDKLLKPLLETRIDKTKFKKIVLANDDNWDAWEGDYWNGFDDKIETIVHTQGDRPRPSILSVDFGALVTLSRLKVYQRPGNRNVFAFTHGNPKTYTLYGAKEYPGDDGNLDNWIKLKECVSVKPSGSPIGVNTDEDIQHLLAGDEYTFDEQIEIRYFRLVVHSTWDGAGYINFSEITFWGNSN